MVDRPGSPPPPRPALHPRRPLTRDTLRDRAHRPVRADTQRVARTAERRDAGGSVSAECGRLGRPGRAVPEVNGPRLAGRNAEGRRCAGQPVQLVGVLDGNR